MTSATDLYRQSVERLARDGVNQRVTNTGPNHAEIVLANMFRGAKFEVRILSGSLRTIFNRPDLKDAAKDFLERGGELKIRLTDEISPEGSEFVSALPNGKHLSIERVGKSVFTQNHFAVADCKAYRLETNDKKAEAVVNFNEPDIAIALAGIFDRTMVQAPAPASA